MKRIVLFFALLAACTGGLSMVKSLAHADPGGRVSLHGYFSGKYSSNHDNWNEAMTGFPNAIPANVNTRAEFIAFIKDKLNDTNRNALAAAFIVNLMLGRDGSNADRTPSAAMISDWESRINNPAISIHRGNLTRGGPNADISGWNSAYAPDINDEVFYPDNGTDETIYFTDSNGNILFAVKTECGNAVGDTPGLPVPKPTNAAPTGSIGAIACSGTQAGAKAALSFYDNDGGGAGGNDTYAYAKVAGASNNPTAAYTGTQLSTAGWTLFGPGNTGSIPIDANQTGGNYAVFLYVRDVGSGADGNYHSADKQVISIACNHAPTGSIGTISCTTGGDAKAALNFSDADSPDGSTYAYATVAKSGTRLNATATDATLQKYNWTGFGPSKSGSLPIDNSYTAGGYAVYLYVFDRGPAGDGLYHYEDTQDLSINCAQNGPAMTAAGSCTTISGTALDSDSAGTQLRIDVYEGNSSGYAYRQYTTHTSGSSHAYSIGLSNVLAGNTQANGSYNPYPSPATGTPAAGGVNAHPGASTDYANQTFYVYAVGVNSSGTETGPNTSKMISIGPCVTLSCGGTTYPAIATVGEAHSFQVYAKGATSAPPGDPTFSITVAGTGIGTNSQTFTNVPPLALSGGNIYSSNAATPSVAFTPVAAGSYSISFTYNGVSYPSCGSFKAGYSPYFNILGGDAAAGPGFGSGCTDTTNAGIYGSNVDGGMNGSTFFGAGSQLASLAMGDITSFATSQNSDGGDAGGGVPSGLAFANTSTAGTTYGRNYRSDGNWCATDYVNAAVTSSTNKPQTQPSSNLLVDPSGLASGAYQYNPSAGTYLTLNASGALSSGKKVTLVVYGDVYITSPIDYQAAAYDGNPTDIPQFKLLVKGNIYVDKSVGTLRGFYDAQDVNNAKGAFYSCAMTQLLQLRGITNVTDPLNYYNDCKNPLTVYGGVAARTMKLGRTAGSIAAAPGVLATPAESFVFTPELWLADLQSGGGTSCSDSGGNCTVQAFTSLPPIL